MATKDDSYAHALRVSSMVPKDYQRVAWLHDAIEDGYITGNESYLAIEFAQMGYGLESWETEALILLTRLKSDTYMGYINRIDRAKGLSGQCARAVKICDLQDNLARPGKERLKLRYRKALKTLNG